VRFRVFLSIMIPYLICLVVMCVLCNIIVEKAMMEQSKSIMHQEFTRFSQDIVRFIEKNDDYESQIKSMVSNYKVGSFIYAWLLDKNGNEVAFSQSKRYVDPGLLIVDKEIVIPYVKNNFPSGSQIFSTRKGKKIVEYAEIKNTPFILLVAFALPRDTAAIPLISIIWISTILLFAFGFSWGLISSRAITKPFLDLIRAIQHASVEEPFQKPSSARDPEFNIIYFALERLQKLLNERKATDLNPLTNMPGDIALQKELFDIIDTKEQFAVGEIDINHFSSFNHKYGFKKGDSVIRFLGATIQSVIRDVGEKTDFVAHMGGDHFVFVTRSSDPMKIAREIIPIFDDHIPLFYSEDDRKRGYILSKNRRGEIEKYPFMRISIGIASNQKKPLIHPLQIANITNEIVNFLKKDDKSNVLLDRRLTDREGEIPEGAISVEEPNAFAAPPTQPAASSEPEPAATSEPRPEPSE
jgi:GGDEF domain-containing protein